MAKFSKKPVVIEAFTFEEFLAEGMQNATSIVNGVPWAFTFRGHACTHERDDLYLIPTLEGVHNMTPDDMVIVGVRGEIYPCKIDIFHETYDPESPEAETYTTIGNETVMGVAYRQLGDFDAWRELLVMNPKCSRMLAHQYFPEGTLLNLPRWRLKVPKD